MQVQVRPEPKLDKLHESNLSLAFVDHSVKPVQSESALPFRLQQQLKSLREYVDNCRSTLNDIHMDFEHFRIDPDNTSILFRPSKQLGRFCLEADDWGFHLLYDVALALQKIILECSGRDWSSRLCVSLQKRLEYAVGPCGTM
jgi:hypothetical protein